MKLKNSVTVQYWKKFDVAYCSIQSWGKQNNELWDSHCTAEVFCEPNKGHFKKTDEKVTTITLEKHGFLITIQVESQRTGMG